MQEEYAQEGIDWSYVEFVDNQDCLDLLEGGAANPKLAVFPLIDEACRLPRATYEVLHRPLPRLQTLRSCCHLRRTVLYSGEKLCPCDAGQCGSKAVRCCCLSAEGLLFSGVTLGVCRTMIVMPGQDLAHTLRTRLAEQPRFAAPKRPQHSFGVEHYAGRVTYVTNYLMDKNKDFVIQEHAQLMRSSGFDFVRQVARTWPLPPSNTDKGCAL